MRCSRIIIRIMLKSSPMFILNLSLARRNMHFWTICACFVTKKNTCEVQNLDHGDCKHGGHHKGWGDVKYPLSSRITVYGVEISKLRQDFTHHKGNICCVLSIMCGCLVLTCKTWDLCFIASFVGWENGSPENLNFVVKIAITWQYFTAVSMGTHRNPTSGLFEFRPVFSPKKSNPFLAVSYCF